MIKRRAFLKMAGLAVLPTSLLAGSEEEISEEDIREFARGLTRMAISAKKLGEDIRSFSSSISTTSCSSFCGYKDSQDKCSYNFELFIEKLWSNIMEKYDGPLLAV